jgi:hypothetical protein
MQKGFKVNKGNNISFQRMWGVQKIFDKFYIGIIQIIEKV